jgi:hypothetical protein
MAHQYHSQYSPWPCYLKLVPGLDLPRRLVAARRQVLFTTYLKLVFTVPKLSECDLCTWHPAHGRTGKCGNVIRDGTDSAMMPPQMYSERRARIGRGWYDIKESVGRYSAWQIEGLSLHGLVVVKPFLLENGKSGIGCCRVPPPPEFDPLYRALDALIASTTQRDDASTGLQDDPPKHSTKPARKGSKSKKKVAKEDTVVGPATPPMVPPSHAASCERV